MFPLCTGCHAAGRLPPVHIGYHEGAFRQGQNQVIVKHIPLVPVCSTTPAGSTLDLLVLVLVLRSGSHDRMIENYSANEERDPRQYSG